MIMEDSLIICQFDERLFIYFFAYVAPNEKRKLKKTSTDFFQAVDYLLIDLAGLAIHLLDKYYHRPDSVLGEMPVR